MYKKIIVYALVAGSLPLLGMYNSHDYRDLRSHMTSVMSAKSAAETVITSNMKNRAESLEKIFNNFGHSFTAKEVEALQKKLIARRAAYKADHQYSFQKEAFLAEYERMLSVLLKAPAIEKEYQDNKKQSLK